MRQRGRRLLHTVVLPLEERRVHVLRSVSLADPESIAVPEALLETTRRSEKHAETIRIDLLFRFLAVIERIPDPCQHRVARLVECLRRILLQVFVIVSHVDRVGRIRSQESEAGLLVRYESVLQQQCVAVRVGHETAAGDPVHVGRVLEQLVHLHRDRRKRKDPRLPEIDDPLHRQEIFDAQAPEGARHPVRTVRAGIEPQGHRKVVTRATCDADPCRDRELQLARAQLHAVPVVHRAPLGRKARKNLDRTLVRKLDLLRRATVGGVRSPVGILLLVLTSALQCRRSSAAGHGRSAGSSAIVAPATKARRHQLARPADQHLPAGRRLLLAEGRRVPRHRALWLTAAGRRDAALRQCAARKSELQKNRENSEKQGRQNGTERRHDSVPPVMNQWCSNGRLSVLCMAERAAPASGTSERMSAAHERRYLQRIAITKLPRKRLRVQIGAS